MQLPAPTSTRAVLPSSVVVSSAGDGGALVTLREFSLVNVARAARTLATPVGQDARPGTRRARWLAAQWSLVLVGALVTVAVSNGMWRSDRRFVGRAVDAMGDQVQRSAIAALSNRFHELDGMAHRRERMTYATRLLWQLDAAQYVGGIPDYSGLLWIDDGGGVATAVWHNSRRAPADERAWGARCAQMAGGPLFPDTGIAGRVQATRFERTGDDAWFAGCAGIGRPGSDSAIGWIVGVFSARRFLDGVVSRSDMRGYRVSIADRVGGPLLATVASGERADGRWTVTRRVAIGGQRWQLSITPTRTTIDQLTSPWPAIVLGTGLTMSLLMAAIARLVAVAQHATRGRARAEFALNDLVETDRDAIETTTRDGRLTHVNAAWRTVFGYGPGVLPAGAAESQLAPEARGAYAIYRAGLLRGDGDAPFEGPFLDLSGVRHVLSIRSTVRRVDGVPIAVRSVLRDVTAQRAVEDERARLAAVLDATPDFVGIAGGNGRAVYINRSGRRMLGILPGAEVSGIGLTAVYPPDARAHQVAIALPTAFRDGFWSGETTVRDTDGRLIPVSQVLVSHPSSRGGGWFVSTIMRDRRAQVQREDELRLLQQTTVAIGEAVDAMEAHRVAIRELCSLTSWPYGEAWVMGEDALLRYAAVWHDESAGLGRFAEASAGCHFPAGSGLAGTVWATKAQTWVHDLAADDRYARAATAAAAGLTAAIGVPVLAGDEIVAVLAFHLRVASTEDARRAELVTVVAAQLGRQILHLRAEHELRDSEERNRRLSDASTDGIVISRHGVLLEANAAFRRLFLLGDDVAGFPGAELFIPADRPRAMASIATHGSVGYEATALRLDGTTFEASVRAHDIPYAGGVARLAVLRDITEWKELDRLKNEFVSTVSHELRTPLTSLRGSLGLLEGGHGGALTAKGHELVAIARSNTDRLIRLINDMLDLDKMAAGRLELQLTDLDPVALVRTVVDGVRGFASQRRIEIRELVDSLPMLVGDHDRIVQVLTNLVSNAIKFSPPMSTVTIRVAAAIGPSPADPLAVDGAGRVRITVSNPGVGISPADLTRLFTRFQQLDGSDGRRNGGTGLGLAISKAIIDQHGGTIGVQSVPGGETTFWCELPAAARVVAAAAALAAPG